MRLISLILCVFKLTALLTCYLREEGRLLFLSQASYSEEPEEFRPAALELSNEIQ